MFYITLFFSMIFFRFSLVGQERLKNLAYKVLFWFLFLFSSFRLQVGCDWSNYLLQYEGYRFAKWTSIIPSFTEPFYIAILRLVYFFDLSFMWLNVIFSGVFFYGVNKLALRQKDPFAFLLFLFPILILNMPMSGIRQGAAIGMMCLGFVAFMDKKLLSYIFFTFMAIGFHTSALIFLALAPFVHSQFSIKRLFLAVLLSLPMLFILYQSSIAEIISVRYLDTEYEAAGAVYRLGSLLISSIVFFLFFKNKIKALFQKEYSILVLGFLIAVACFFMIPFSSTIADRFGYYLIPLQAMFFAQIPYLKNLRYKFMWTAFPYILVSVIFMGWVSLSALFDICYDPYLNYITGVPLIEGIYGN